MRKFLSLTIMIVILIGLLLSGCSKSGNGTSEVTDNPSSQSGTGSKTNNGKGNGKKEVTITVWNRIGKKFFAGPTKEFEKEHPNIHVKVEQLPPSGRAKAQYQAAVSNNSLPDIFYTGGGYSVPDLIALDQLHSLKEIFPEEVIKSYPEGTFAAGENMVDGEVYCLPMRSSIGRVGLLYYNKDVLKKYGIQKVPKTWDEMIEVGKQIYEKSGGSVYGLIMGKGAFNQAVQMAHAISQVSGAGGMNYKTGQYDYATKGYIETFEFFKKLYDEKVLSPQSLQMNIDEVRPVFAAGQAAFIIDAEWLGAIVNNRLGFKNWGVAPLPTKNGKKPTRYDVGGASGVMVSKYTKHWPEVKLYLKYLRDHINETIINDAPQVLPVKPDAVEGAELPFPQYDNIVKLEKSMQFVAPNPVKLNPATAKVGVKFNSIKPHIAFKDVVVGYISGQIKDAKSALQKYSDGLNKAFKEALKSNDKVTIKDYQFPNWVPREDYTDEDYQELKNK